MVTPLINIKLRESIITLSHTPAAQIHSDHSVSERDVRRAAGEELKIMARTSLCVGIPVIPAAPCIDCTCPPFFRDQVNARLAAFERENNESSGGDPMFPKIQVRPHTTFFTEMSALFEDTYFLYLKLEQAFDVLGESFQETVK